MLQTVTTPLQFFAAYRTLRQLRRPVRSCFRLFLLIRLRGPIFSKIRVVFIGTRRIPKQLFLVNLFFIRRVTKQEIEAIRGVKCDFAVNKLVEYKLVKELGRLDTIGKPIVFGTTEEFLRCFGVSSIEELPDIDEVTKQSFMEEAMEEVAESLNVPV